MFEKFSVVDLKKYVGKEKNSYYLVIYSDLEYVFRVYMTEEQYNILLPHMSELYSNFDVEKNVRKIYNEKNKNFSYFLNLAE